MKELILKIKKDFAEKTNPGRALVTGDMVKFFVLRVLLAILTYVIIDKLIVKISIGQYIIIDLIFQTGEYFVYLLKKK